MADEQTLALLRRLLSPAPAPEANTKPVVKHSLDELFPLPPRQEWVKIRSMGQVGYLPKANLDAARVIDKHLKVLEG
jgi:hypothetical protein